ncbi:hypothetical protein SDC9_116885 [bioreactor metagenome]|uniref:UPF0473 protein J2Z44_000181 n=2 Tax=root TaxID=1 RepID=A0ABS4JZI0_9CLOT|nr:MULTISPECIES: DUF1292 domain-containing protein [Clostridium]EQB88688.1 hypothetical protein M918_23700 [Clostridium sp. BL8]MBP2020400.1 uncharacterized protein YrzB (UPF0473 family) [Clostridium punense]
MDNFLERITLTDEEGNDVEFEVITKLDIEENEYFIVVPAGSEDLDAVALKVVEDEAGNEVLVSVDDEDEFNMVAEAYETLSEEGLLD